MANIISDKLIDFIINEKPDLIGRHDTGLNISSDEIYDLLCRFYSAVPVKNEDLLLTIYIGICKKVPLNWNNYEAIAYCLNSLYPNTDLLEIDDNEVIEKVIALPNFTDKETTPPEDIATAIITIWVEIYYDWEL